MNVVLYLFAAVGAVFVAAALGAVAYIGLQVVCSKRFPSKKRHKYASIPRKRCASS